MVDGGGDLSEEMVLVQARPPASCLLLGFLSSCPVPARDLATRKVVRRLRGGEYMAAWTQDLKLKDRLRPGGPEEARAGGLSGGDGLGLFGLFIQIWKVFFLSPFESRRPWPKRSALQIQRAGLCQPCRAYPLPFLAISAPSQPPEAWNQPVCAGSHSLTLTEQLLCASSWDHGLWVQWA